MPNIIPKSTFQQTASREAYATLGCLSEPFQFKGTTTTQALNFFAIKAGGVINKNRALMLIYFSDRYYLRYRWRPITGDTYYATRIGPMAWNAKQFAQNDIIREEFRAYNSSYIEPVNKTSYRTVRPLDTASLAELEMKAFEWTWGNFRTLSTRELTAYVRRYPEWKACEKYIAAPRARLLMNYFEFLEDSEIPKTELCHLLTPKNKERAQASIKAHQDILAIWPDTPWFIHDAHAPLTLRKSRGSWILSRNGVTCCRVSGKNEREAIAYIKFIMEYYLHMGSSGKDKLHLSPIRNENGRLDVRIMEKYTASTCPNFQNYLANRPYPLSPLLAAQAFKRHSPRSRKSSRQCTR
ncbi:hypothetical protein M2447_002026 [Ereboglobus sp. PH5-10]|uniref:Panacea domain-containing protein n=1 Tax=Ereboglobus sp. PH5-10 TaxID=2940629 RepID=UPI002405D67D|nr:Panacea domain-containing protein [Ereboglobus sp. PH5-10]MDF9827921.1 hypothetical protein [Ereboglobus sp. PH5-10]